MTTTPLSPDYATPAELADAIRTRGYGVLSPAGLASYTGIDNFELPRACWDELPEDPFLKDGGHYRRRRHSCFIVEDGRLNRVPHRAHYQPLAYNALHGGMHRLFEPIGDELLASPAWSALLLALATTCSEISGKRRWHVEAHQFRIDTGSGIGRPTPEGAHRDGVDFVAILLVAREGISGGESRIFEAEGPNGQRFTLGEAWTLLLLDDLRVIHESTPIRPTQHGGHRDTLVLTFRAEGFLEAV